MHLFSRFIDIFLMKCIEIYIYLRQIFNRLIGLKIYIYQVHLTTTFLNVMSKLPGYVTDASETVTKYVVLIRDQRYAKNTHIYTIASGLVSVYICFFCKYLEK